MLLFKHKLFYLIFIFANFYPSLASANTVFDDYESGCNCAKDLTLNNELFIDNKEQIDTFFDSNTNQNISNLLSENSSESEKTVEVIPESNQWHFQIQPYFTVPVNTYGTATARGRTVDYHLSLGETLDSLNFTASARFEAWKGRLGFIVDGYYVNLGSVADISKQITRNPSALNSLNYLTSKATNTRVTDLVNNLDQKIETAKENAQGKKDETIEQLDQQVENLKITVSQDLEKIQAIDTKVEEINNRWANISDSNIRDFSFQDLDNLQLTSEGFKELLALNVRDFPKVQDLRELNQTIKETGVFSSLPEIKQELNKTREILEQGLEKIKQEKENQVSEDLEKLQLEMEEAKTLVEEELAKIQQLEDFLENRSPQNLDLSSKTNLSFQQGIYDFALSYHFGEFPNYRLPDKPSGRNYPIVWFQPIAGVRLNNLSVNIEQTINVNATSSLVNFSGSFQNDYGQTRTWFEPMIGAKLGAQLSDTFGLWLRGDASGFGLAGETDMSWNLLGGMDWWVGYKTSLQLGYRFYNIDYSWGSGNNAFGFKESFNGPFLSATFHF
jgi:phage shock protein A